MSNSAFAKSSIQTPVSVANGGTGATTSSAALTNLGAITGVSTSTAGFLTGGTSPSAYTVFESLRTGANNGAVTATIDGVTYNNIPVSMTAPQALEQENIGGAGSAGTLTSSQNLGQSFMVTGYDRISKVSVMMKNTTGGAATVTASIRTANGSELPTGTDIGAITSSVVVTSIGTSYVYVDFTFPSLVPVTNGAVHCIVLSSAQSNIDVYGGTDTLPTRMASYTSAGTWYQSATKDMQFRIYGQLAAAGTTESATGVAGLVQTAIRAATGSSETVTYLTNKYIITSGITGEASKVLKLMTPTSGTDISGNNATKYLDCGTGGTETLGAGHSTNKAAVLVGGITPSATSVFNTLGSGANDGKVKFSIDGTTYDNVAVSANYPDTTITDIVVIPGTASLGDSLQTGSDYWVAQTMTTTATQRFITTVSFYVKTATSGGTVRLNIKTPANINTANVLATASTTASGANAWTTFTLATPLEVLPSTAYVFCLESTGFRGEVYSTTSTAGGKYVTSGNTTWIAGGTAQSMMKMSGANATYTYSGLAANLQSAIRTATTKTETVTYTGSQYVVKSSVTTPISSVLKFMTPTTGTDLSGVGATKYFDLGTNATEVPVYTEQGKIVKLDENGELPSPFLPDMLSYTPMPAFLVSGYTGNGATDTSANIGMFSIPFGIMVSKLSLFSNGYSSTQTSNIAVYSENGQTRLINSSIVVSGNGLFSTTLTSPVYLSPGNYYIASSRPNSTVGVVINSYTTVANNITAPAGSPVHEGTLAITGGTLPLTITPSAIAYTASKAPAIRFN